MTKKKQGLDRLLIQAALVGVSIAIICIQVHMIRLDERRFAVEQKQTLAVFKKLQRMASEQTTFTVCDDLLERMNPLIKSNAEMLRLGLKPLPLTFPVTIRHEVAKNGTEKVILYRRHAC